MAVNGYIKGSLKAIGEGPDPTLQFDSVNIRGKLAHRLEIALPTLLAAPHIAGPRQRGGIGGEMRPECLQESHGSFGREPLDLAQAGLGRHIEPLDADDRSGINCREHFVCGSPEARRAFVDGETRRMAARMGWRARME